MSEETFGQAGLEADAGFVPLVEKPREEETHASAREAADHIAATTWSVAEHSDPLTVIDPDTGEEAAPNKTLTLDQASELLHEHIQKQKAAAELASDFAIAAEIDAERGTNPHALYDWQGRPIDGLLADDPAKEASKQPAKEPVQAEAKAEKVEAPEAVEADGLTPSARAALQNPQIRQAVEQQIGRAEEARQTYA